MQLSSARRSAIACFERPSMLFVVWLNRLFFCEFRDLNSSTNGFHRYDDRASGGGGGGYGGGYRGGRSPQRRGSIPSHDKGLNANDIADERPRSRSPRRRSPRNDYRERQRTPTRDYNDRPRSSYRRRSGSINGRDRSPARSRNDAPQYREKSPVRGGGRYQDDREKAGRRNYQGRDGPRRFPVENNYRPGERARSPPRRTAHASHDESPHSQPLSRRGSPPPPLAAAAERARSPARDSNYNTSRNDRGYHGRAPTPPPRRARSPPRDLLSYRDRSPVAQEDSYRERSPPRQQDDEYLPDADYDKDPQADYHRDAPPTGPSYRGESVPGESRHDSHRESTRGGRYGSNSHRQSHDTPSGPRSGGPPTYENAPHSGKWSSQSQQNSQPRWESRNTAPAFRGSSNSTSTTYPRTQRFNAGAHLSGVPSVVEGGKKQPSLMDPEHEKKLQQLEEDKKKLEAAIMEKQRKKRSDLRTWDKLEREAKSSQLRSDLAEEGLSATGGTNLY